MTISNTQVLQKYAGDGSQTQFAVPFPFQSNAQITVYVADADGNATEQTEGSDYDWVAGDPGTHIDFDTAPALTEEILIIRETPKTQTSTYTPLGPFPAASHERTLDKIVQMLQELGYDLRRTSKTKLSDTDADSLDMELPVKADRAGLYAAWDADGKWVGSTGSTMGGTIVVSAFMETLLDDGTAADARTTLGFVGSLATAGNVDTNALVDSSVTMAKLANMAGVSVIARAANTTGVPAALAAAANFQYLARLSDALSFDYLQYNVNTTAKTSNYQMLASDYWVYGQALLTPLEIALPAVATVPNRIFVVTRSNTDFQNDLIVTTSGGTPVTRLHTAGETVWLYGNGSTWTEIHRTIPSATADLGAWVGNITAVTTAPTFGTLARNKAFFQRSRNRAILEYQMHMTTNGTNGSGNYLIPLPSGLQFNTTKYPVYNAVLDATIAGHAAGIPASQGRIIHATGPTAGPMGFAVPYSSTQFRIFTVITGGLGWGSGSFPFGATMAMSFNLEFEVSGWNG